MLTSLDRPRDRDHRLHGREAVIQARTQLRHAVQDCGSECLDLQLVCESVFTQDPVKLPVTRPEALDVTRFVKPRQMHTPGHAAILALNLKTLLKVSSHRDLEIEMSQRAVGEIDRNVPAITAETLE